MEEVTDAFRRAGATAPGRARSLADLGVPDAEAADALARAGVLVRGPSADTWYVDEAALAARRAAEATAARRRPLYVAIGMLVFLLTVGLAWWIKGG
jgi:hypothetical protein